MSMSGLSSHSVNEGVLLENAPKIGDIMILSENIKNYHGAMLLGKGAKICISDYQMEWDKKTSHSSKTEVRAVMAFVVDTGVRLMVYAEHFHKLEFRKNVRELAVW